MEDYSSCYSAREKIVEILKRDFIGPVSEDEILTELPTQYYLLGKLYPKQSGYPAGDNMPIPLVETSTDTWDTAVSLSNQYNPSSLALTCSLKPGVDKIRVRGSCPGKRRQTKTLLTACESPRSAIAGGVSRFSMIRCSTWTAECRRRKSEMTCLSVSMSIG